MMEYILNRLSHILNRLFSNKRLRSYEDLVINAWRTTLPEKEQQTLDSQLMAAELMQRQAGGAKVCFYYSRKENIPFFKNCEQCAHVATVVLIDKDRGNSHRMNVKLFVVNGRFFSIEFPKRPMRYMQQHNMKSDALQVAAVKTHIVLN